LYQFYLWSRLMLVALKATARAAPDLDHRSPKYIYSSYHRIFLKMSVKPRTVSFTECRVLVYLYFDVTFRYHDSPKKKKKPGRANIKFLWETEENCQRNLTFFMWGLERRCQTAPETVSQNDFRACFEELNDHVTRRVDSEGNCVIRDNTCGYCNFISKYRYETNLVIQQPHIVYSSYLRLGLLLRVSFRSGIRNKTDIGTG
jgi:hypothetical protein